jgi:pilus assembly protein Flp/PilA
MTVISKFLEDDAGASAAEYALILAIVAVAIVTSLGLLAGAIENAINSAATKVNPA